MAKYRLTGPDGSKYDVTAPDDATEDDVMAHFQANVGKVGGGKLDLLLEAERRGILPDDKKDLLAEARNRGLVPALDPQAGYKRDIAAEAAKRQSEDSITAPAVGRVQSSLDYFPFFGAYPQ